MPRAPMDLATVLTASAFTRPADTTAYTAGDLVANSTTAGSVVPVEFENATVEAGAKLQILRARIVTLSTSLTNAQFRVHIFGSSPVSAAGDNAAFSCPKATYAGALDVTLSRAFSDGAAGAGVPTTGAGSSIIVAPATTSIYALVEALAAYTPTSGGTFTLALEVLRY